MFDLFRHPVTRSPLFFLHLPVFLLLAVVYLSRVAFALLLSPFPPLISPDLFPGRPPSPTSVLTPSPAVGFTLRDGRTLPLEGA